MKCLDKYHYHCTLLIPPSPPPPPALLAFITMNLINIYLNYFVIYLKRVFVKQKGKKR